MESLRTRLVEVDKDITREAARIKAIRKMAYADCIAVAMARLKKADFIQAIQNLRP